jgi:RNA 3'-terminal phosphate cyclase (ATP)
MIELDGSLGEGGGQILRTALALSLITGKAFSIDNIRAKRPKPGLMRQHLACVQAAVAVGGGAEKTLATNNAGEAVQIGETSLTFTPDKICAGDYKFAIGSAGSCMLVLQTVLWPLVMADGVSTLTLRGGTHNPMAPSFSFLSSVFLGQVSPSFCDAQSVLFETELRRHGFYPAGGGEVQVRVRAPIAGIKPLSIMQRGALRNAYAESLHAGIPKGVAERELAVLQSALGWKDDQMHNRALRANEGPGNVLMVTLEYEHITEQFSAYGERGVSAEQVARSVLQEVRDYQKSEAPVGPHLADQLMIPLALAAVHGDTARSGGSSAACTGQYWATELTEHTRTNAAVIEQFLPVKFAMQPHHGGFVVGLEK